jgi:uncharacterized membrane protein
MRTSKPRLKPQWTQSTLCPITYIVVNACAALVSASAAMLVPRELRHLYPIDLVWFPVAAFSGAALSSAKSLAPWLPLVSLGLNTASLALFFLAAYASVADATVGPLGLAYALPGAAVAGWNLRHLAAGLAPD